MVIVVLFPAPRSAALLANAHLLLLVVVDRYYFRSGVLRKLGRRAIPTVAVGVKRCVHVIIVTFIERVHRRQCAKAWQLDQVQVAKMVRVLKGVKVVITTLRNIDGVGFGLPILCCGMERIAPSESSPVSLTTHSRASWPISRLTRDPRPPVR